MLMSSCERGKDKLLEGIVEGAILRRVREGRREEGRIWRERMEKKDAERKRKGRKGE